MNESMANLKLIDISNEETLKYNTRRREQLVMRFHNGGQNSLFEYEILEILLLNASLQINIDSLAKRLLSRFGNLNGVVAASKLSLFQVKGVDSNIFFQLKLCEALFNRMGRAKLVNRDIISSWNDLVAYCRTAMAYRETEQLRVLFLNQNNEILAEEMQANGTLSHVFAYPREIARRALELNANALIIVHNHPSGDSTPSDQDIEITNQICMACETINVAVFDHIIIGNNEETSLRSLGLI